MVHEYMFAFYILKEQIRMIANQKSKIHESMSFMLSLIKYHNLSCFNNACFCHHADSLIWVLKRADYEKNENFINLASEEIDFLNTYTTDEFIPVHSKSHHTPLTCNLYLTQEFIKIIPSSLESANKKNEKNQN